MPLLPEIASVPVHDRDDGKRVRYVPPAGAIQQTSATVRHIIFPRYDKGAPTSSNPLPGSEALGRLMANAWRCVSGGPGQCQGKSSADRRESIATPHIPRWTRPPSLSRRSQRTKQYKRDGRFRRKCFTTAGAIHLFHKPSGNSIKRIKDMNF
jgi:hypothetical protein